MVKNFFNISDLSSKQLREIISIDKEESCLESLSIGLLFEKYSTRTRLSFSVGINQLGGNAIDIRFQDLNFSRDESFEDTFLAMNCYLDGLIFRTDDHKKLLKCKNYFKKPIINALSNVSHPCQIISDLYTLKNQFGNLELNILWMGDMNNVCYSLIEATNLIEELNLTICSSKQIISSNKWSNLSKIQIIENLDGIDLSIYQCVMTDVFLSMNDPDDTNKLNLLKKYIVTKELIDKTAKNSVFMHCLPAKVGFEVSDEVFRGKKSIVWKQAYNRLIAQKKLLQYISWR